METVFDWVTVACFAGLIVLMLQRSINEDGPQDSLLHYAPPAIGCAVTNYLGNEGHVVFAVLILAASLAYAYHFLRPFATR